MELYLPGFWKLRFDKQEIFKINGVQKVPEDFWESTKDLVIAKLKEGKFSDGLAAGIIKAGEQLKGHFPYQKNDVNELSDEISFGEKE